MTTLDPLLAATVVMGATLAAMVTLAHDRPNLAAATFLVAAAASGICAALTTPFIVVGLAFVVCAVFLAGTAIVVHPAVSAAKQHKTGKS